MSSTEKRAKIIENILKNDVNSLEDDVQIDEYDILRILAEVAGKRRASFTELEHVIEPRRRNESKDVVIKGIDILRNKRHWIDAIDSPIPELSVYYMTAAGLSALER